MTRAKLAASALVYGAAAGLLIVGACKSVGTLAQTGAVVTLFASPATVAPNGESTLTASVFEASGQPVPDDTIVNFNTTLGTVNPTSVKTRGGFVQAVFRAGSQTGTATVTARSGAATEGTATITVGAGAMSISLSASTVTLPVGGGTTTIIATVRDAAGSLSAGVPVVFTADHGTLASGGGPVVTNAQGEARDVLTTTVDTLVTATVSGATSIDADLAIDVAGSGASAIAVTATPSTLGPGGGRATITATVTDASGAPVVGYPVVFRSSAGSISPIGPVRTNSAGVATTQLDTGVTATVTATGPGATGSVSVTAGRPTPGTLSISLAVSPTSILKVPSFPTPTPTPVCGDPTGFDITLTATVTASGTPVPGVLVVFSTRQPIGTRARIPGHFCLASGQSAPQALTNASGQAIIHYTISLTERLSCDDIRVPCSGASCGAATPCGTATPTPSPQPLSFNDCCCGISFRAQVGTVAAEGPPGALRVMADRDCVNRLCNCVF